MRTLSKKLIYRATRATQERFGVILLYGQKFRTSNVSGKERELPSNKGFYCALSKDFKGYKIIRFPLTRFHC